MADVFAERYHRRAEESKASAAASSAEIPGKYAGVFVRICRFFVGNVEICEEILNTIDKSLLDG